MTELSFFFFPIVSGFAEHGYQEGFHCDNCMRHNDRGDRWLCMACSSDICLDCCPSSTSSSSPENPAPGVSTSDPISDATVDTTSAMSSTETAALPVTDVGSGVAAVAADVDVAEVPRSKRARRTSGSGRRTTFSIPPIPSPHPSAAPTSSSSSSSSSSSTSISAPASNLTTSTTEVEAINSFTVTDYPQRVPAPLVDLPEVANSTGTIDKVAIPFPILGEQECMILANISGSEACGGVMGKRLMKILRPLALYDGNWTLILESLSVVGGSLAVQALKEITLVRSILSQVVEKRGNAQAAMSLPQLTTPRSVSELRLLQVLRLMTVLRTSTPPTGSSSMAAAAASVGAVTDLSGSVLPDGLTSSPGGM